MIQCIAKNNNERSSIFDFEVPMCLKHKQGGLNYLKLLNYYLIILLISEWIAPAKNPTMGY